MIDDRYENVFDFHSKSDKPAILLNTPYNNQKDWALRANSWFDIVVKIRDLMSMKEL